MIRMHVTRCTCRLQITRMHAAGDALRPFLMHAFGGLYIDLDVQCFRSAEPSLLGHDVVLQSEYREGRDVVNSIMASVPGHPFWKAIITEMLGVRTALPCMTVQSRQKIPCFVKKVMGLLL